MDWTGQWTKKGGSPHQQHSASANGRAPAAPPPPAAALPPAATLPPPPLLPGGIGHISPPGPGAMPPPSLPLPNPAPATGIPLGIPLRELAPNYGYGAPPPTGRRKRRGGKSAQRQLQEHLLANRDGGQSGVASPKPGPGSGRRWSRGAVWG
eukprot:gene23223-26836_t